MRVNGQTGAGTYRDLAPALVQETSKPTYILFNRVDVRLPVHVIGMKNDPTKSARSQAVAARKSTSINHRSDHFGYARKGLTFRFSSSSIQK